jgi:hypothetical protein
MQAQDTIVVHVRSSAAQQDAESAVAESRPLSSKLGQSSQEVYVVAPKRHRALRRTRLPRKLPLPAAPPKNGSARSSVSAIPSPVSTRPVDAQKEWFMSWPSLRAEPWLEVAVPF